MPKNLPYIRSIILGFCVWLLLYGSNNIHDLYDKNKIQTNYYIRLITAYETKLCANATDNNCIILKDPEILKLKTLLKENQVSWEKNETVREALFFIVLALVLMIAILTFDKKRH